ncbi:RHE_PE00001 family protein [Mesorhizobium sp. M0159]|uniref:RHE_PE00001 family protein n=1 Tax=Mesorhizobium sp. M0159 TaxID=2956900 RepID=UPI00333D06C9
MARLDERLARSPVRDGLVERQHFADTAAALWLEGELVHLEDLVLHDAHMDIGTPTHELTRAHAILRTRRRIFANKPDWALGRDGFLALTGRGGATAASEQKSWEGQGVPAASAVEADARDDAEDDLLAEEFAEIDAVLARSSKILSGADVPAKTQRSDDRPDLIHDLDWNEDERLAEWRDVIAGTRDLPVVLRGAILFEAWQDIEVLQHAAWIGPLLVAALLGQEGLAAGHLACLHLGAKNFRVNGGGRAIVKRLPKLTPDRRPILTPPYGMRGGRRSPGRSWSGLHSPGERGLRLAADGVIRRGS